MFLTVTVVGGLLLANGRWKSKVLYSMFSNAQVLPSGLNQGVLGQGSLVEPIHMIVSIVNKSQWVTEAMTFESAVQGH